MGESTCSSKFVAAPVYAGGRASMHMETLTEIAMERCASARCAIATMGALAVAHGFYGPEWDDEAVFAQDEAGEAMTVSDPHETWMFHVLPDDTGASAIWVAQRVPDDHITAVANQFVIQEMDLGDEHNFMASSNVEQIAIKVRAMHSFAFSPFPFHSIYPFPFPFPTATPYLSFKISFSHLTKHTLCNKYTHSPFQNKLWHPESDGPLNFARVFGNDRHASSFACTRRVWRVFTLAAPSLLPVLSGYTDGFATFGFGANLSAPYPFSVKVDSPLTVQDIMNINRDQYEGSAFDLTQGTDAGPFGDPMRYAPVGKTHDPVNGLSADQFNAGLGFQRPISLWRTAYSSITQSRAGLPDEIGAVTWVAQYAPHHASFLPVYASAATPSSLNTGTQYRLDKSSNYWIHCLTGNYLSRWYAHTIGEVQAFQRRQEAFVFAAQAQSEQLAARLLLHSRSAGVSALQGFAELMGATVRDAWWTFFFDMAGTFRDMYMVRLCLCVCACIHTSHSL